MHSDKPAAMNTLLRNLELHLTGVGLLVVVVAGLVSDRLAGDIWVVTALTAIGVGIVHGIIFWLVRRRQRLVREADIAAVQHMLKDVVKNQLAVLRIANELNQRAPGTIDPARIDASITEIAEAVDSLSQESLRTWQARREQS